jgi:hypothetical protein
LEGDPRQAMRCTIVVHKRLIEFFPRLLARGISHLERMVQKRCLSLP